LAIFQFVTFGSIVFISICTKDEEEVEEGEGSMKER
jgi:hypothetical protein